MREPARALDQPRRRRQFEPHQGLDRQGHAGVHGAATAVRNSVDESRQCRSARGWKRHSSGQTRGYATSRGEIFVGAVAVSAPYFDHRGSVVGSVGIYGPNARIDEPKMLEYSKLVRKAGQEISVVLGFQAGDLTATKDTATPSRINRHRS